MKEGNTMKVIDIFTFKGSGVYRAFLGETHVCYEFEEQGKALNTYNSCKKRDTARSCFMSNGLYYVQELLTDEVIKTLLDNNSMNRITKEENIKHSDMFLFHVEQQAYGDMRYYFNNSNKKFYFDFFSIGD